MNLSEYLKSIRAQLTMQPKRADQIVAEIEQHIKDQTKQHLINGITVEEAEQQSCEEFGKSSAVAQRFNKTYRHPLHSFWRVVGVALLVYTVIRALVIANLIGVRTSSFDLYEFYRGFYEGSALFVLCSCLVFAAGTVLMGRFIHHYLVPLNVSVRMQRLSLLLAAGVIAFYHLLLSMIQYMINIVQYNPFIVAILRYNNPYSPIELNNSPFTDPIIRYIGINLLYVGLTTVVVFLTIHLTFWWLQKRQPQVTLTSA